MGATELEGPMTTATWELGLFTPDGIEATYPGYARIQLSEEEVEELFSPYRSSTPRFQFPPFQGPGSEIIAEARLITQTRSFMSFEFQPRLRLADKISAIVSIHGD